MGDGEVTKVKAQPFNSGSVFKLVIAFIQKITNAYLQAGSKLSAYRGVTAL